MALAAACRLTVGLAPGAAIGAALSAPLPAPEGHILFPTCDRPLELINASALLVIAQDGQVIADQGEADREAAALHAAFHDAAERGCLAHLPAPHASALMLSPEWGLDQLTIGSMRFVGEIAKERTDEIASLDGADAGRRLRRSSVSGTS